MRLFVSEGTIKCHEVIPEQFYKSSLYILPKQGQFLVQRNSILKGKDQRSSSENHQSRSIKRVTTSTVVLVSGDGINIILEITESGSQGVNESASQRVS